MRRVVLVLTVAAMVLLAAAVPALSQGWEEDPESWKMSQDEPATPHCEWFYYEDSQWDPWWEYWCWWRGWGWEFVFWVWD